MTEHTGPGSERYRRYETARNYLAREGIRTIDRNWKSAEGTLDIVATERNELVVVLLQTTGTAHTPPRETMKRHRRMAVAWMHAHGTNFPRIRVDVVSVHLLPYGQSNLEHARAVDGDLY